MRRSRLFSHQAIAVGQALTLDERNNHYLLHVLRIKPEQTLIVFDGSGNDYLATVTDISRKTVTLLVNRVLADSQLVPESPLKTTLAIAVSKGERMDWVMQKATELGVSIIQPLLTERVDVKLNSDRQEKKWAHWQAVVISACEQSGRTVLPQLNMPAKIGDWLATESSAVKLVLKAHAKRLVDIEQRIKSAPTDVCILIGPEGGLNDQEVLAAEQLGFIAVGFGKRILRTETAPIVALSLVQERWGDF